MPDSAQSPPGPLGLLAGNGRFPLALARAVRAEGREVVAVGHLGETEPELARAASAITWVRVGQLGQAVEAFRAGGVREAVLLGGIRKTAFFGGARPDAAALRLIASVAVRSDDSLLRAVARFFETEGIRIVPSAPWLGELSAPEGTFGRHAPTAEELEDVRYGFALAKALGRHDVGQTVVVKSCAPLALEAIEGTDACIARGGKLARGGAVVVKVVKPAQDDRFDLPAVGSRTVKACLSAGVRVLAVEAGGTLLADREEMVRLADRGGLALLGVRAPAEARAT